MQRSSCAKQIQYSAAKRRAPGAILAAALLLVVALPAPAAAPSRLCRTNTLCVCHEDHFACNYVPFHRFPDTDAGVAHVSVSAAQLGVLAEAALDARPLRTLVLVGSRLHHVEAGALAAMVSTLASLDLGHNEFTQIPIESLRDLKVLNWLSLQNNYVSEISPQTDWGFLVESLSSLSLSNNRLCVVSAGALAPLRRLAQLDLSGNRLRALAPAALPPALSLLRLADNLLPHAPCPSPRLQHLQLRNNLVRAVPAAACPHYSRLDSIDLSHNELDDSFYLNLQSRIHLKQLILDLNEFTSIPSFVLDSNRLEKLSISYNRLKHTSETVLRSLKHNLERLNLDHNNLTFLPEMMSEMMRLRYLSVAYNRLEDLSSLPPHIHSLSLAGNYFVSFPSGLYNLTSASLTYLDLGYNQISIVSGDMFGSWSTALATLNLKGNLIGVLSAATFPVALPLRELVLSFNDLYYVDSNAFLNLTMLQVLEMSTTLLSGEFPITSPVDKLLWLSLDNNNIHYISSGDFYAFPLLEYVNLDFNKLTEFPNEVIYPNVSCSCKLKELRLSYNYIGKINSDFLQEFAELQSIDLSYNRLRNVTEHTFTNLQNLVYLNLAENMVEHLANRSFHNLPKLEVLELQHNELSELSTQYFENVSDHELSLSVNVSFNKISILNGGERIVYIGVLDLSHNLLESMSNAFFHSIGPYIRQLILSHNRIKYINNFIFGPMPLLDVLSLHHNNISIVKKQALNELSSLQMLDLSHNRLAQVSAEPFQALLRLRHLQLNGNGLRLLPRDSFKNTLLEYLDLSDNQITLFPSSALAHVGFTLRRLELARNRLEHLDVAMFQAISFLHELNLASNVLTVLSDNTFAGLTRLTRLDLSQNAIKTNFKESFHNLPRLRRLGMAGAGLKFFPNLPLANLTELNMSANLIFSFRDIDVRRLVNLRTLDISRNRLTSLQPTIWSALPQLTVLDVSHNPIVRVMRGSFDGLTRLLHLRMDHLGHLETIEPRAFRSLVSLRSLTVESRTSASREVADIVSATNAIESLAVHVHAGELDGQLHGLLAPKLRALEVRGCALRRVSARAFSSLGGVRALSLRLVATRVAALPVGLLQPLARVPHLALDLSDNRLVAFAPAALYPNLTGWTRLATKLIPGNQQAGWWRRATRCRVAAVWRGWARGCGAGRRRRERGPGRRARRRGAPRAAPAGRGARCSRCRPTTPSATPARCRRARRGRSAVMRSLCCHYYWRYCTRSLRILLREPEREQCVFDDKPGTRGTRPGTRPTSEQN